MKKAIRRVPAKFTLESHFDVPIASVPLRGPVEQELERLKHRLLEPLLQSTSPTQLRLPMLRAASEAATLAWMTPYPLLVLPVLLEEKAHEARLQSERQEEILERSQPLLAEVA